MKEKGEPEQNKKENIRNVELNLRIRTKRRFWSCHFEELPNKNFQRKVN